MDRHWIATSEKACLFVCRFQITRPVSVMIERPAVSDLISVKIIRGAVAQID